MNSKPLIIAHGFDRSETAGLLQALASLEPLSAGDLAENRDLTELNGRVLMALGAGPHVVSLCPEDAWKSDAVRALMPHALDLLRGRLACGAPLTLDTPGAGRLVPFWLHIVEDLDCDVRHLVAWRAPAKAAAALSVEQHLSPARAYLLWLEHYVAVLTSTRGAPRIVVDTARLLTEPENELERFARFFEVQTKVPEAVIRLKRASSLRDIVCEGFPEPGELVHRCAAVLEVLAAREVPSESSIEDEKVAQLDAQIGEMAPFLDELESREREAAQLGLHVARLRGRLGATAGQLEHARRDGERLRAAIERAEHALKTVSENGARAQARFEATLKQQETEIVRIATTLAQREAQLAELLRERATFGAAIGRAITHLRGRVAPAGTVRGRVSAMVTSSIRSAVSAWRTEPATATKAAALSEVARYALHLRERLAIRTALYPEHREPGLLSFMTPVWNTPADYLDVLAKALLPQIADGGYEWVVLDNGCTDTATLASLRRIGSAPGVRMIREERNVGIIAGMRRCLEAASGRYVVPLDHDDYVFPDCARLVTGFLRAHNFPSFIYTDEDKLEGRTHLQPYFKPAWDPVLFVNSCYVAHLCVFRRDEALALGAYTDTDAEGSPDWDTCLRFYLAGHVPRHLAEVVYSWRLHPQSTSARINSKAYVFDSHRAVLSRLLAHRASAAHFRLETSPLFLSTPDHWLRRNRVDPRPLVTAIFSEAPTRTRDADLPTEYPSHRVMQVESKSASSLRAAAQIARDTGALLHLLWDKVQPIGDEWPWEALGLMELFPDCVMVGGRVLGSDDRTKAAGYYFGFGSGCDCPDRGRAASDPGYFAQMWKPHTVSAVSVQHAVVDPRFLLTCLEEFGGAPPTVAMLGAWLGAAARRAERRVIYTPFFEGRCDEDLDARATVEEKSAFIRAHRDLLPDVQLLSPRLGLWPQATYQPVSDDARHAHLDRLIAAAESASV